MRRYLTSGILLATILLASCRKEVPVFTDADVATVNQAINKLMVDMDVPGVVFEISIPGKADLLITKGVSDIRNNIRIDSNNLFRIGSITKTFTAVTVLQLAEEGKLSLDGKLALYEPRIPNAAEITLRMLMNHTCGIYSYTDDTAFVRKIKEEPLKAWSYEELIAPAIAHGAVFPPGTSLGYSNTAYILLGKIIETVTGHPAAQEIKTRVIDRLGLKNTVMASGPDISGNYAHLYTYDLNWPADSLLDITRQELGTWGWTAGGLISDRTDMNTCAAAFANGDLLSPAMQAEFLNWISVPVSPGTPQDSYTGLGIVKYRDVIGNSGGTYGCSSWMWHMPANGATLTAFFNQTSTFTPEREVAEQTALAELFITTLEIMRSK